MAPAIISRAEARAQGLKRYFTGRQCPKGHVAQRLTSGGGCAECAVERQKTPHGRAAMAARAAKWRAANPDNATAAWKKFQAANPKKRSESSLRWQAANPEKARGIRQRWLAENSAAMVAYNKVWREANPEKAREHRVAGTAKRRARKRGSGGTHTTADLREIFSAQNGRCVYCKANLSKVKRHVDHITPLAKGGSNGRTNLQLLCAPCNLSKGARDPIDFAQSLGLLL